jgi:hypothetical protein
MTINNASVEYCIQASRVCACETHSPHPAAAAAAAALVSWCCCCCCRVQLLLREAYQGGLSHPLIPNPEELHHLTPEVLARFVAQNYTGERH